MIDLLSEIDKAEARAVEMEKLMKSSDLFDSNSRLAVAIEGERTITLCGVMVLSSEHVVRRIKDKYQFALMKVKVEGDAIRALLVRRRPVGRCEFAKIRKEAPHSNPLIPGNIVPKEFRIAELKSLLQGSAEYVKANKINL